MPSPWREAVNATAAIAFLLVAGLVVTQSWQAVALFAGLGQKSTTAAIPMVIPHAALLVGFALMFLCVAVRFRAYVAGVTGLEIDAVTRDLAAPGDAPR
jgi:TRAP-type C4-dicarboxylate transport system permease small subunit